MATYDILITNGKLVDGTGAPWTYGDLALKDDRIAAVAPPGTIDHADAAQVVDATGMVVCPGFIDIQSHSILPLMVDGRCLSKITQGVTTEIMGEGWTPAPVARSQHRSAGTSFFELAAGTIGRPRSRPGRASATGWRP